jgi:hypothetical protein
LPTLGRPTMPQLNPMGYLEMFIWACKLCAVQVVHGFLPGARESVGQGF